MKTIMIALVMAVAAIGGPEETLKGKWKTNPSPAGNVTSVNFKADNLFEGFVNNKPIVSGKYWVQGDQVTIIDNGCNGEKAIYKLAFFSGTDSLRLEFVEDPCLERKEGISKSIWGRVK